MHSVAAFFASIITFVSGFFAPAVASNSPVNVRTTQPAAAAVAQTELAGNPFNDPAAASAVAAIIPLSAPAPVPSPPSAQTVINQPVIEQIVERVVPQGGTISAATLTAILTDFEGSIEERLAAIRPPAAVVLQQVAAGGSAAGYAFVPASQRIDQLTNTAINTPTITGGSITNSTVSGTLSGTFSGTSSFTAATTSSLAISSIPWGLLATDGSGNLVATSTPTAASFVATSTVASRFPYASSTALSVSGTGFFGMGAFTNTSGTTTVALGQGFSIGSSQFVVQQGSGNVGIGTTTPNVMGANANSRVLSISGDGTVWNGNGRLELMNPRAAGSLAVGDDAGRIDWTMSNNGGGAAVNVTISDISAVLDGVAGASGFGGKLQFKTKGNNDSFTSTRVVIDNSGNVGIGTTSPAYALDVNGDVNVASGKCFRVAGTCIGYVVKLAAIYATSTPSGNSTTTVVFTGAQGSAPSYSSNTLTLPSNASYIVTEVWGGGGGGGGTATGYAGGGGGAGYSQKVYTSLAATYFYNVGKGGAGGAASDTGTGDGAAGAASSFGTGLATSTANGGGGGAHGANNSGITAQGGAGGTASGGDVNLTGGGGGNAYYTSAATTYYFGGFGGSAPRGGGGGRSDPSSGITGEAGAMFGGGGGGGGGGSGSPGGAGGSGGLVITIYATSSPNAAGNDYAENFPVSDPGITAGDIVSVDTGIPVSMRYARKGDTTLAGIISTQPGQLLGDKDAVGMRPVALAGRVPTKVNMENGPIALGDRIAISSIPGVGMKAGPFDDAVGIALESTHHDGTIMTFVTLSRGIDINAIAMTLLGNDAAIFAASTTATSTAIASATTGPLDFVGGMMSAIATRISLADSTGTASTTATATSTSPVDSYASNFLRNIFTHLIAWFANSTNGIGDFFARVGHFDETDTKKLCLGSTCVTEDELKVLLAASGQQAFPSAPLSIPNASIASSTPDLLSPPVIEINGNNPAIIHIGDAYTDLGATIIGPQEDLNLGITTLLDGATTTQISIDTSQPGEHTISYTVTSPTSGLTGRAIRTVIISPAEQSPEQPANDNPFNAPPANDNVSTSTLLNTEPAAVNM